MFFYVYMFNTKVAYIVHSFCTVLKTIPSANFVTGAQWFKNAAVKNSDGVTPPAAQDPDQWPVRPVVKTALSIYL